MFFGNPPWTKKEWLGNNHFLLGTFVQTSDPTVVEILAWAGFDFVLVDCEHGPLSAESMKGLMVAASASGIVPIVRVKQNNSSLVMEPLDSGALGVQIPHIKSASDARNAVTFARFHPDGERGVNPHVRATHYRPEEFQSYMKWANENNLVVVQVEGVEGVDRIDDILSVEGIDVIFLGPYDLSQSTGVPGQVNHPAVEDRMKTVIQKAKSKGMAVGTFADNAEAARKWLQLGIQYMVIGYETRMLYQGAKATVSVLKNDSAAAV
jgi:4-hydroxy-2-oxoheptanedioate aldolase